MGPTSENAGYVRVEKCVASTPSELQWVRRPRTPVMETLKAWQASQETASMGPTSENAGYGGPQGPGGAVASRFASTGPTCENAGYGRSTAAYETSVTSFNGSDVRERRLW